MTDERCALVRHWTIALMVAAIAYGLLAARAHADEEPPGVWFARDRAMSVFSPSQAVKKHDIGRRRGKHSGQFNRNVNAAIFARSRARRIKMAFKPGLNPLDVRPAPQVVGQAMLAEARRFIGSRNPTGLRADWCGAFLALVARRVGAHVPSAPNLAASWAHAGQRLSGPAIGALAVMRHHVTIITAVQGGRILGLGGNQHRRVQVSTFAMRRVIAFVRV